MHCGEMGAKLKQVCAVRETRKSFAAGAVVGCSWQCRKISGAESMKKMTMFVSLVCCGLGLLCYLPLPGWAIDVYFDTEISTKLEPEPNTGMLYVTMLDEEVPQVFPDIVYEQAMYVEIILDASRTMNDPDLSGIKKFDVAKELVALLVKRFPQRDTRFALRVNGAKSPNNCLDSELVVPFSRENAPKVLAALPTIRPQGLSPVTYALRQVLTDFTGTKGTKMVFLVTDGLETCDNEPTDACTATMDLFLQAEFEGAINIIGVNTINDDARALLDCLSIRGKGEFLDTNRNKGPELAKLLQSAQQLSYSISKVLDAETLAEGKILEFLNRRIGDVSVLDGERIVFQTERRARYSSHELKPGIYKIEFATVPVMASYFTVDRRQKLTIGIVRSGQGIDLYDRAHLALGNRYYDTGQVEQALAEYQKVLAFDNRNVEVHLNMGIIYDDLLKDKAKAVEHYKAYLELQGPRQEEVGNWLRKVRGEPSQEETLQQKARQVEAERAAQKEKAQQAEIAKQQEAGRQKGLDAHQEILTANTDIRQLAEEDVISGDVVKATVSDATTDSKAQNIALDVGRRIQKLLNRTPNSILVYRENKPDAPVAQAKFDVSQKQYVPVPGTTDITSGSGKGSED